MDFEHYHGSCIRWGSVYGGYRVLIQFPDKNVMYLPGTFTDIAVGLLQAQFLIDERYDRMLAEQEATQ